MICPIYGIRRVDMVDESNKPINGYSCFIGIVADGVEGYQTTKVFIRDSICQLSGYKPSLSEPANIEFNPNGKVAGIYPVNAK